MQHQIFIGNVYKGKFSKSQQIHNKLKEKEGKEVAITIQEPKDVRTLKQNSYFHLCLTHIAKEIGEPLEIAKMLFKDEYGLYDDVVTQKGDVKRVYHKTSQMSVSKFAETQEFLKQHGDFLGVKLPEYEGDY